jgi:hypothetical protein
MRKDEEVGRGTLSRRFKKLQDRALKLYARASGTTSAIALKEACHAEKPLYFFREAARAA